MKRLILLVLTVCILSSSIVVANANDVEELYLSALKIIYADKYKDAVDSLKGTEFDDYKVLDINLNKDTGKTGVYLAYKTTTDVDEAITDLSVMQMGGGYRDGNYQEMIQQSFDEYIEIGEIYLDAIDYFLEAYYAGAVFAEFAYRQLNLYYDEDSGKTLGVLFEEGIGADALATMFLQGNSYALGNIRSILAQGVSYNEDGTSFLERVEKAAEKAGDNPSSLMGEDYDELAALMVGTLATYREMFEEYESVEDELNYDDEFTEVEAEQMEVDALASLFKDIKYLSGRSFYDFCRNFKPDEEKRAELYPLVAAMNKGQIAMTKVGHFYDVVRYSFTVLPEEMMEEQIVKLEADYGKTPFGLYTGVDRSIYEGTFALTTEAYRADSASKVSLLSFLLSGDQAMNRIIEAAMFSLGVTVCVFAKLHSNIVKQANIPVEEARREAERAARILDENAAFFAAQKKTTFLNNLEGIPFYYRDYSSGEFYTITYDELINSIYKENPAWFIGSSDDFIEAPFHQKITAFYEYSKNQTYAPDSSAHILKNQLDIDMKFYDYGKEPLTKHQPEAVPDAFPTWMQYLSPAMYILSGVLMIMTAVSLYSSVKSYYNPEYDDIPSAMINLIDTADGDRYIKYDAVTMIDINDDDKYDAADLNAFKAQRWNALYYTKNYEAGKPLLADFKVSYNNNAAGSGYLPVHRFGEEVCYDLNKYNFDSDSARIYLSVKQSDAQKSAVADVPPVVGAMISNGRMLVVTVIGMAAGATVVVITQKILNRRKMTGTKR